MPNPLHLQVDCLLFLGSAACHKKVKKRKENVESFFSFNYIFAAWGATIHESVHSTRKKDHTSDKTIEEMQMKIRLPRISLLSLKLLSSGGFP